jgi:hypothetical protein
MKKVMATLALSCFLSVSILAGQIPTDGSPVPPPAGTNQATNDTNPGEIPSGGEAITISDAALTALMTALGLASI